MKYDTAFWKKVLSEYENGDNWPICYCSNLFKNSWFNSIAFKIKIREIATNWPGKPNGSIVRLFYLFYNDDFNAKAERQTRLDFLKYIIKNKIEFEV